MLVSLRNQGRLETSSWLQHGRLGFNYRLDDISAALGIGQMEKLDRILEARRDVGDADNTAGQTTFDAIGCASCHLPELHTGEDDVVDLSEQTIRPYTDLLLHDMGEGLADHRPEGMATGSEWRTAPLWGLGITETVSGHTLFLHDGRARNITEAILWHGGEAQASRDAYAALSKEERDALDAFVNSL